MAKTKKEIIQEVKEEIALMQKTAEECKDPLTILYLKMQEERYKNYLAVLQSEAYEESEG